MAEIDINGLLTTDQREELIDAAASTYVAATLGSTDDEIAAKLPVHLRHLPVSIAA